jgi:hypothetical protein
MKYPVFATAKINAVQFGRSVANFFLALDGTIYMVEERCSE